MVANIVKNMFKNLFSSILIFGVDFGGKYNGCVLVWPQAMYKPHSDSAAFSVPRL